MKERDRQTRFIGGILILVLVLSVTGGCGRKGDPAAPEDYPPKETGQSRTIPLDTT